MVPEYPFSVLVIVSYLILLFWRKLYLSARNITISKHPSVAQWSDLEEENKNLQMFRKSKKQIKAFAPTHSNAITTQSHCVLAALLSERVSGVLLLAGASLMKGTMQRLAVPARRLKLHPGFNCCEQEEM